MGIARKPSNEKLLPANESEENLTFLENGNRFAFFGALSTLNLTKILDSALSGKLNSSSTQGSTHSVTWSLELVTIIAMPPPPPP